MAINRLSVSSRVCVATLAFAMAIAASGKAQTFEITTEAQVRESWSGFGDDFDPAWSGVTKRVDWTLPKPANYGSAGFVIVSMADWGGLRDFDYKPIELLWSKRSVDYSAEAAIDKVVASDANNPESSRSGLWSSTNARYGEVTDLKGTLLANGSVIGTQRSDVNEASLTAAGRVSASVIMESSMLNRGQALAASSSQLQAAYRVNEPANFSLSGVLAGGGDLSLDFNLVDASGNAVYRLSPAISEDGGAYKFDLQGTLDAGTYTLSISADVAARMGGRQSTRLGGSGEYEISFSATPVTPFVPREKPQPAILSMIWPTEAVPAATDAYQATVPEPASLSLLFCGLAAFGFARNR